MEIYPLRIDIGCSTWFSKSELNYAQNYSVIYVVSTSDCKNADVLLLSEFRYF